MFGPDYITWMNSRGADTDEPDISIHTIQFRDQSSILVEARLRPGLWCRGDIMTKYPDIENVGDLIQTLQGFIKDGKCGPETPLVHLVTNRGRTSTARPHHAREWSPTRPGSYASLIFGTNTNDPRGPENLRPSPINGVTQMTPDAARSLQVGDWLTFHAHIWA